MSDDRFDLSGLGADEDFDSFLNSIKRDLGEPERPKKAPAAGTAVIDAVTRPAEPEPEPEPAAAEEPVQEAEPAQMQEPEGTAHDPEDLPFLREDVPSPSLTQEETLQNAPAMRDGCFALPRAMGGKAHA